jgi:SAM-dependent methyltransferase
VIPKSALYDNAGFWQKVHDEHDIRFLTFTPPDEVLRLHDLAPSNVSVLDIGVGNGDMSRHLVGLGNSVVCCDICDCALNKCSQDATKVLSENLKSVGPFDLAIAHLVFQHLDEADAIALLESICLSARGLISVQTLDMSMQAPPDYPLFARDDSACVEIFERSGLHVVSQVRCASDVAYDGDRAVPWSWTIWRLSGNLGV